MSALPMGWETRGRGEDFRFDPSEAVETFEDLFGRGDEAWLNPQPLPPRDGGPDTFWPSQGNDQVDFEAIGSRDWEYMMPENFELPELPGMSGNDFVLFPADFNPSQFPASPDYIQGGGCFPTLPEQPVMPELPMGGGMGIPADTTNCWL